MKKQYLFHNYYKCYRCNEEWEDVWSATCDDDCPHCARRTLQSLQIGGRGEKLLTFLCAELILSAGNAGARPVPNPRRGWLRGCRQ